MRTIVCDKQPPVRVNARGERYVRYADLPAPCTFCGRPAHQHKSNDPKRKRGDYR
jgi:hypothetical protein